MSLLANVADAVVTALNSGPFDPALQARRLYQPVFDLPEMDTLHVSVVPKSIAVAPATRGDVFADCAIDIGVQQKVDPADQAALDALVDLVEAIGDHLRSTPLTGVSNCQWVSVQNDPLISTEHLDQFRQFTSIITVTYRVKHR